MLSENQKESVRLAFYDSGGGGPRDDEINNQSALFSVTSSHDVTLDFGNGPTAIHNFGNINDQEVT